MSNLEIVQELYQVFRDKDYDAFRKICTPEVEWIQNGGFPHSSTRRGADAVINDVFQAFNNDWDSWRFQIEEHLDAGRSVVVLGFYEGTHQVSRKSFRSAAAHVYELVDGKVARFRQFADTKVIWDVMS